MSMGPTMTNDSLAYMKHKASINSAMDSPIVGLQSESPSTPMKTATKEDSRTEDQLPMHALIRLPVSSASQLTRLAQNSQKLPKKFVRRIPGRRNLSWSTSGLMGGRRRTFVGRLWL